MVLIPGGASEASYCGDHKEIKLVLKRRRGFIKMALENGVDLVPSFSFGETDIYQQFKGTYFTLLTFPDVVSMVHFVGINLS